MKTKLNKQIKHKETADIIDAAHIPIAKDTKDFNAVREQAERTLHFADTNVWDTAAFDMFKQRCGMVWIEKQSSPLADNELSAVWENAKQEETERRKKPGYAALKYGAMPAEELKTLFTADKKKGMYAIAHHLIARLRVKTIANRTNQDRAELLTYREGVYGPGESILRGEIESILEEESSTHYLKEIVSKIRNSTLIPRKSFDIEQRYINLANGILDIETMELLPHSPDLLFLHQLPVVYNPAADCPAIKKFLSEVLTDEFVPIIQEFVGYGLYRRNFVKKAVILTGEGNTGKSTFINLITSFYGEENIVDTSLQYLANSNFASAGLYQKHLNFHDDLDDSAIENTGMLKILVGDSRVGAEHKFGDRFNFRNFCKLLFACNDIPAVKDVQDDAYFLRWIIIPFFKKITNIDEFLIDRLTTPGELSGLLNFALLGLKRLLKSGDFSYAKDTDAVKEEMLRGSSTIARFVYDCLEQAPNDDKIDKEEMYQAFASYARSHKLPVDTKDFLGKNLYKYATYISDSTSDGGSNKERVWRNVGFKEGVSYPLGQPGKEDNLPDVGASGQNDSQDSQGTPLSPEIAASVEEAFKLI